MMHMARHRETEGSQALFRSLQHITAGSTAAGVDLPSPTVQRSKELRKMKKFRFQLLHRWLTERFEPCRVADIGGGKGLFAFLMQQSGWDATVIDPIYQDLPHKYKDFTNGRRVKIAPTESVPHINQAFMSIMAQDFDLLVGMHAHGCNAAIIDAAVEFGCGFVIFPCCVIDEPFYPVIGVDWLECLADYAVRQGHHVMPFRLNFKGQNIGLAAVENCQLILNAGSKS